MNTQPPASMCLDWSNTARQRGWNRRVQRIVIIVTTTCLFIITVIILRCHRQPQISIAPELRPKPLQEDGRDRPEFYQWKTLSSFTPVSQSPGGASKEQLCRSFPNHLLQHMIQPVLKIGHTENRDKVEAQLTSVSACVEDLLIFSDLDETIHGRHVIDILQDLPAAYHYDNPHFVNYTYLRHLGPAPTNDLAYAANDTLTINGWVLDKYKFLPMVVRAWTMRPNRQWYFFYETDTYVFWDNVFRFLQNLDHDTPLYIGSPSPGRLENAEDRGSTSFFANGGPGFALSRAAVFKLLARKVGKEGDYLEAPLTHRWLDLMKNDPCGDSILGWALHKVGIKLSGFWPLFNPHALHTIPFPQQYWCQPVLTLHKTKPEDMGKLWLWEQNRRIADRPLLYRDLFDFHHKDRQFYLEDWDNGGWEEYAGPRVPSFAACGEACAENPECFQYYWHLGICTFSGSIRYGEYRSPEIPEEEIVNLDGKDWTYEESRFFSGWSIPKIDRWRDERMCDVVQWVRPSLTRIF